MFDVLGFDFIYEVGLVGGVVYKVVGYLLLFEMFDFV